MRWFNQHRGISGGTDKNNMTWQWGEFWELIRFIYDYGEEVNANNLALFRERLAREKQRIECNARWDKGDIVKKMQNEVALIERMKLKIDDLAKDIRFDKDPIDMDLDKLGRIVQRDYHLLVRRDDHYEELNYIKGYIEHFKDVLGNGESKKVEQSLDKIIEAMNNTVSVLQDLSIEKQKRFEKEKELCLADFSKAEHFFDWADAQISKGKTVYLQIDKCNLF